MSLEICGSISLVKYKEVDINENDIPAKKETES